MKIKSLVIPLSFALVLSVGCSKAKESKMEDNKTPIVIENDKTNKTDVVAMPSRVADEDNLFKALDKSWIILVENDITTTKDIVLNTGYEKTDEKNESKKVSTPRVLVLCTKDANKNIDKNFTLTTPKVTVKDEGAKIEGGVLKGDLYIEANNIILELTKIEGNVYFSSKDAKDSIVIKDSTVTGTMDVK
ncbi:hypothetical protein [Clostridium sp.]|uniref:hypothetical protein n=1 Tax=Clostridium sp. TaxID=1506 RepID=UPI00262BD41C|nr:hypothetical protein [Clostridium sp.]